ncbi:PQQ-binding-like beta-propeller repeat protein [Halomontanus rarus]|uniref:outer membrane protein assembly factor BamB family protein n=1 Tax=Halomontanus rarus TaxID=3034020 RepID=UPI001A99C103
MAPHSRRYVLHGAGVVSVAAIAGCVSDESTDREPNGNESTTDDDSGSTETETEADTEAELTDTETEESPHGTPHEYEETVNRSVDSLEGSAPAEQYDAVNSGSRETTGTGESVSLYWRRGYWRTQDTSVAVVGDRLYLAGSGNLAALDRRDGSAVWTTDLAFDTRGTPAVADGVVYQTAWNGVDGSSGLHAVDAETGERLWHVRSGENVGRAPTVADGTVYTGGGLDTDGLSAHAADSGDERWSASIGQYVTTPAVADGVVYVGGGSDGDVVALEADDGTERWRYETADRVWTPPTVADGTVYAGVRNGMLLALDAADGELLWETSIGSDVRHSVALDDETVYATRSEGLTAIDRQNGRRRWLSDVGDTAPVVVDGAVYVGSGDDVVALESSDGTERWSYTVREITDYDVTVSGVRNTPVVLDGIAYVTTHAGYVYALGTMSDGEGK